MKIISGSRIIVWILYLVALTPLVFLRDFPFEYPLGKMVFFRGLIEIAVIAISWYLIYSVFRKKGITSVFPHISNFRDYMTHPLFFAMALVILSSMLSTIFAINPYRAFFGDIDRQSGFFPLIHYFLFLLLSLSFFSEKEWLVFFKISLVVSTVLVFYGLLQFWDVSGFPFALPAYERTGSFVGNPAFFATHLIFTLLFASIVFFRGSRVWKWYSAGIAFLSLIMIFITATRGAILGIAVGILSLLIYLAFRGTGTLYRIETKKIAWIMLGALLLFGAVFFATKESPLWQRLPGFDRLATTDFVNVTDHSSRQRILAWRLALDLFKEKPILGWGVDGFLPAYLMRYNPEMSLYGETWLDKSHNFVMDALALQGMVGFVAIFGFFLALFSTIWKLPQEYQKLKLAMSAGIAAYFIQNLFLFDQIVSYIALMSIVGFVMVVSGRGEGAREKSFQIEHENHLPQRLCVGFFALIAIGGAFYGFYFYNIVPYIQAHAAAEVKKGGHINDVLRNWNRATVPYNFAQYGLRGDMTDFFYNAHRELLANPNLKELTNALVVGQEELISREPFDVRPHIRVAELADLRARQDPSWYKKGEEVMRSAIQIAPKRPELYYRLAIALGAQGNTEEAVVFLQQVISFLPEYWKSYYYLGVIYELSKEAHREEAMRAIMKAEELNPGFRDVNPTDLNNIIEMYVSWGEKERAARLIVRNIDAENLSGDGVAIDRQNKEWALGYFILQKEKEKLITLASFMARELPDAKADLEILIDLAERGEWEIIEDAFLAR